MNVSNTTGVCKGWDRESIAAAMAKMAKIERPAHAVRLSQATFYEFCRQYTPITKTPEEVQLEVQAKGTLFGLRIVFDETLPFGEYKLEP